MLADVVRAVGGEAVMTSAAAASGTDRLAEAARSIRGDVYVNVQGDEPLMDPENIDRAVDALLAGPGREIASGRPPSRLASFTPCGLPKVWTSSLRRRGPTPANSSSRLCRVRAERRVAGRGHRPFHRQPHHRAG